MLSLTQIHAVIEELKREEVTPFFAFNEIKNILLDEPNVAELGPIFAKLFELLNDEEISALVPYLITTASAKLNRFALYELSNFLHQVDTKLVVTMLLDKYNKVPQDSFEMLRQYKLIDLTKERVETLVSEKQYEKLAFLVPEIRKFDPDTFESLKLLFSEQIPEGSTQHIHGIDIETFDLKRFLKALDEDI